MKIHAFVDEDDEPPATEPETKARKGERKRQNGPKAATEDSDVRPPEFSDDALALRFADQHANELRYVADWGKWLCWDGARWQFDRTLAVFDRARAICRGAAAGCNKPRSWRARGPAPPWSAWPARTAS